MRRHLRVVSWVLALDGLERLECGEHHAHKEGQHSAAGQRCGRGKLAAAAMAAALGCSSYMADLGLPPASLSRGSHRGLGITDSQGLAGPEAQRDVAPQNRKTRRQNAHRQRLPYVGISLNTRPSTMVPEEAGRAGKVRDDCCKAPGGAHWVIQVL